MERRLRRPASRLLPTAVVAAALGAGVLWLLTAGSALGAGVGALLAGGAFLAGGRFGAGGTAGARAPRSLETALDELARARDERDELQRVLAHDLRSPLGAVVNFVSVLEEGQLDAEALDILTRIRRAAESGLRLADGLTRLARVSRSPLHREPVDVEPLVREVFADLGATTHRVELSVTELPPALADRALLRQALAELLDNAVKFSAQRDKAQVGVGGHVTPEGDAVYWVADDGVGFDPASGSRLFHAFERLHPRDHFPGVGVGLAVVRRIAERHGGTAWAEGDPERGARVFLSLPGVSR